MHSCSKGTYRADERKAAIEVILVITLPPEIVTAINTNRIVFVRISFGLEGKARGHHQQEGLEDCTDTQAQHRIPHLWEGLRLFYQVVHI